MEPHCLTTFQDDSTEEEARQVAAVTRFDATNASEEDERHSPLPTGPPPRACPSLSSKSPLPDPHPLSLHWFLKLRFGLGRQKVCFKSLR